jgi:endonuclease/exonuclease/phosphatase family metal-dependent hydrolase
LSLLVRTWNLYHGRTHPKSQRTYLERMVRLVSLDAPDIVALQEVPLWALGRLERWSGMQAIWAVTVPSLLGPVARVLTDVDPVRVRFTLAGQANAILLNPHFVVLDHKVLVMNPDVSTWDWVFQGRQRRVCQAADVLAGEARLVVGNLHATNEPEVARTEVAVAAELLAAAGCCVLCGDFNVAEHVVPDFSPPIPGGIDQILVRGTTIERGPERWPKPRRRLRGTGLLLSDHAPVEAVLAWT